MFILARTAALTTARRRRERLAPGPALLFILTSSLLLWLGLLWALRLLLL